MARPAEIVDPAVMALAQTRGFSVEERQTIIALMRTHTVDQACAALLPQLGTRDFEWPEFDRWYGVFARRGHFPPLWDGVARRPCPEDRWPTWQAYRHGKLYLLLDWLHGLVVTRAEMRAALARYAGRGLAAQVTRQSAEVSCPACDTQNNESIGHRAENVPPFHPGCRCLILAAPVRARHEDVDPRRRVGGARAALA
jgi:hypothetical protein